MKIRLNGAEAETGATSLAELCAFLGYDEAAKIATAVNGEFVPASARNETKLTSGDDIEILAPRQGG